MLSSGSGSLTSGSRCAPYIRCWFADTVVRVNARYNLTVDVMEAAALEGVLRNCPSTAMQSPKR